MTQRPSRTPAACWPGWKHLPLARPGPGVRRPHGSTWLSHLLAADQPDEAAQTALEAVTSGRLVPSNYWRAAEVIRAVQARSVPEATELHEAYRELCAPAEDPLADG
ncbi:hypothetical protein [Actinomadura sp. 9N215]|uniref:hypothetical protein n=1 Tax=Actinomadura sp. 9N215 TaxID=3375150 RepID=UPI0037B62AAC